MLATTVPLSPVPFQLRLARRRNHVLVNVRLLAPSSLRLRRSVLSAAPPESHDAGGELEPSRPDTSRDALDFFSGWLDGDNGGGSPRRDRFGGILGAGLAGVFFAAGITFASVSLGRRNISVAKHQMEALITPEKMLIASDDQYLELGQAGYGGDSFTQSKLICSSSTDVKGTDKDSLYSMDAIGDVIQSSMDNTECLETVLLQEDKLAVNGASNSKKDSSQYDVSVSVNSEFDLHGLPASDVVGMGSSVSMSRDTNIIPPFGIHDTFIEHTEDLSTDNPVNFSFSGTRLATNVIGHKEENLPLESENLNFQVGFSREHDDKFSGEVPSSNPLITDSGAIVNSQIRAAELLEMNSILNEHKNEKNDSAQVPDESISRMTVVPSGSDEIQNESIISCTRQFELDETGSSISFLLQDDFNGNESDINSHVNRSSLFDSVLHEKSFSAGIPAPSLVFAASETAPGKVLVPPVVDQVQGRALAALQALKVIEADVQPADLCTRREYARWLVYASSTLLRNTSSKVYPAMYIENMTELAFDDVAPNDSDFPYIQGLAEAGLITSKLSGSDTMESSTTHQNPVHFFPERLLSRQDLVSWKMALEKRLLPEVERDYLYRCSRYIDIDKINPDAWPALVADLSRGDQSITALAFGYTRLFRPEKPVTKAQASIALSTGDAAKIIREEVNRIEAESLAESAVNAHNALVAQVEKDLHLSYEKELANEREKINALEKLADEAKDELERLRFKGEDEKSALIKCQIAVESEIEVLSKIRHDVEEQLQALISDKMEASFEKDRINKLRKDMEIENQTITQLRYDLEVERKALSMARTWAEEEAKRAKEHARALEDARGRWERQGIKVVVAEDLQDDVSSGAAWVSAGEQPQTDETITRAEKLVVHLKTMADGIRTESSALIEGIVQKILSFVSVLKQRAFEVSELRTALLLKASNSIEALQEKTASLSSSVGDATFRAIEDCKGGVEKLLRLFKV